MELGQYPEYKDSGISWLGEIPAHWEMHRGKWLFRKMERPVRPRDEVITCFRDGMVTLRKNRRVRGFTESIKEIGYQGIRKGDLIIHQMDAFAGAIGVSDSDGKGTPVYSVCQPKRDLDTYFYADVVREMSRSEYILSLAKGIRERSTDFRFDTFASQVLPVPPIEEQHQISDFLRNQTVQINKFIRSKRRLIELLKEQKQNIIYQAMTKGINPDVKLKPSGVEWLGDIPEHWDVSRLKYLTKFSNGIAFKPGDWKSQGVPIIRIQNLNGANEFNYTDRKDLPEHLLIKPGDLLFAWSGNRGTSFGSFLWDRNFPAYLNQHIFKLTEYRLHSKYFYYQLRSVTSHVEETAQGIIGLVHITKPELGAIYVPLPNFKEQEAIACDLDNRVAVIDSATSRAEHEIELIREYRTRLISDVVTGKVDVRSIDIPEVSEEELLDAIVEADEADDMVSVEEDIDETDGY